jgi:hypothetical protein
LKGSGATALDDRVVDVVAFAFFKCRSASRTNQTTSDMTTKLAAATKEKISDRFNMSLLPVIETLAAIAVARPQKPEN